MHRQVGAVGCAFEVARLLGSCFARLLSQEVEVGALLDREQLAEAGEGSLRVFLCIGGWLGVVGDAVSEVDA